MSSRVCRTVFAWCLHRHCLLSLHQRATVAAIASAGTLHRWCADRWIRQSRYNRVLAAFYLPPDWLRPCTSTPWLFNAHYTITLFGLDQWWVTHLSVCTPFYICKLLLLFSLLCDCLVQAPVSSPVACDFDFHKHWTLLFDSTNNNNNNSSNLWALPDEILFWCRTTSGARIHWDGISPAAISSPSCWSQLSICSSSCGS